METKLQTWDDCIRNINLFTKHHNYSFNQYDNGMFIQPHPNGTLWCFMWVECGVYHRVDGPAAILTAYAEWWLLGDIIEVNNQDEFEKWLVNNS